MSTPPFVSRLRPPSGIKPVSKSASPKTISNGKMPAGRSRIPPPTMGGVRTSFLSPKEVWSPLVASPKVQMRSFTKSATADVAGGGKWFKQKFQLSDPGVVGQSRPPASKAVRAIPRPQLGPRGPLRVASTHKSSTARVVPPTRAHKRIPVPTQPAPEPHSIPLASNPSNTSTASSACSSASSLARHRAIYRRKLVRNPSSTASTRSSLSTLSEGSIKTTATVSENLLECTIPLVEGDSEDRSDFESDRFDNWKHAAKLEGEIDATPRGICAPYLVPRQGPPVTLEWERDPEADDIDEAEATWRRLELKMGRRIRGTSVRERGRWVVRVQNQEEAGEMQRTASDFSLSAYMYEPSVGTTPTALFDMSAPLIPSVSSSACTPQNTPCLRRETLQRARRVRRMKGESITFKGDSEDDWTGRTSWLDTDSALLSEPPSNERTAHEVVSAAPMYRLDSQVVSALEALQDALDSPELDLALGLHPYAESTPTQGADHVTSPEEMSPVSDDSAGEGGLGLGIPLQLDSVYHLPVLSPRLRRERYSQSKGAGLLSQSSGADQGGAVVCRARLRAEEDDGVLRIMDLDTGLMREVRLDTLGEEGLEV